MQDCETSQLLAIIKSKFEFLSESEILEFIRIHPWLEKESDPSILLEYLMEFSKGLAEHYNNLTAKLIKMQDEWVHLQPQTKKIKSEVKKIEEEEEVKANTEKIPIIDAIPSEDDILMSMIKKLDEMASFFKETNELSESGKHFTFIYNVLWKILEFPDNPNFRQISIDSKAFMLSSYLIEIFEILGFVRLELDSQITLIYTDDKLTFFKETMGFIESDYFPEAKTLIQQQTQSTPQGNPFSERVQAQMNAPNERQKQQANYLASVYENRITTNNNSNLGVNRTFQNRNNYGENVASIQEQLKDYRSRMRQRNMQMNQFSGNNIMTMNQLYTNQELSYSANPMGPQGYQNKMVTLDDIEKKRIEEDKVNFGKKALQHTNEFRKKQGKPPLEWNQHLCDIGMKHSKDMADQRVPFGHQGFENRAKAIRFEHGGVFENVAYCFGMSDVPRVIFFFFKFYIFWKIQKFFEIFMFS